MEEIKVRYMSRKEYLEKYNSNVGYALYVIDNIKKDDYARLSTGQIVKVIGIKENECNKKAIYYYPGVYNDDWFDSSAVENFSPNIIDVLEIGDIVTMKYRHLDVIKPLNETDIADLKSAELKLVSVVTHEQFNSIKYEVE